jgi:hypothetical protein
MAMDANSQSTNGECRERAQWLWSARIHLRPGFYSVIAETIEEFTDLHDESREHTERETTMGFWEGIRTYPNAAAWSVLLSSSIIMEGYVCVDRGTRTPG